MNISSEMNDLAKKCILFCRGGDEEAVSQQAAQLEQHAKRAGLEVIDCIRQIGGMPAELTGDQAIELVTGRKPECRSAGVLLVTDWSRLTRRGVEHAMWLESELKQAGVKLIVLNDRRGSDAMDRVTISVTKMLTR